MLKDKDIREKLFDFLEEEFGKIRIFEEKNMGRSRADAVMVTENRVVGIEIKSDADTYARLDRQIRDYDKFFDCNYAVVGTSHAAHIKEHVPEWWGIITVEEVDGKADFYMLRRHDPNPFMDWKMKISILWRPELAHIQEINGMAEYKNRSKAFVADKILQKVPESLLCVQMCNELFERDYSLIGEQIDSYRKEHNRRRKRTGRRAVVKAVRKIRSKA